MYHFGFERLKVWTEARKLNLEMYRITALYPKEEMYGLKNQLRRASVSVGLNIAEGAGRQSPKDQALMYKNAYGSLMEVMAGLMLSSDLGYVTEGKVNEIRVLIAKISNQLNALSKSITKNND